MQSFGTSLGRYLKKFALKRHECQSKAKKPKCLIHLGFLVFLSGRGERIRTSGLYVPNVALYQAKLHPVIDVASRDAVYRLSR